LLLEPRQASPGCRRPLPTRQRLGRAPPDWVLEVSVELGRWLREYEAELWDRQIEACPSSGKEYDILTDRAPPGFVSDFGLSPPA
jgi:hypothetical protein